MTLARVYSHAGIEPVVAGLSSALRLRNYSATQLGLVGWYNVFICDGRPLNCISSLVLQAQFGLKDSITVYIVEPVSQFFPHNRTGHMPYTSFSTGSQAVCHSSTAMRV